MIPRLPQVDRVADRLAPAVLAGAPGADAVWQVSGPPSAGKKVLLRRVSDALLDAGLLPVVVTPPQARSMPGPWP